MTIADFAQTDVVTAQADDDLTTVAEQMREEAVGSVVIVAEDEPISIISDRKIAMAAIEGDIADRTAEEFMTDELVTAHIDTEVDDLIETMSDEAIRRVPLVDDEGSLAGVVSMDDLLVRLANEFDTLTKIPERQSPKLRQP
ncbi:CBS domain-containing protein [Halohasta salina]|uniref:CBS domain-containing protein n=1 Tax=Halohasta salina TaxID=2961621 RepID=UPI0020A45DB5|nr:CBS domain-containing protein [Halohasta salina]